MLSYDLRPPAFNVVPAVKTDSKIQVAAEPGKLAEPMSTNDAPDDTEQGWDGKQ